MFCVSNSEGDTRRASVDVPEQWHESVAGGLHL